MVTLTRDNSTQTGDVLSSIGIDAGGNLSGVLRNDDGTQLVFSDVNVLTYTMGSGDDALVVDGMALHNVSIVLTVDGGAGQDRLTADFSYLSHGLSVTDDQVYTANVDIRGFEVYQNLTLGSGDDLVALSDRRSQETITGAWGSDSLSIDNSMQTKGVSSTLEVAPWHIGFQGRFYNAGGTYTQFSDFENVSYRMGRGNDTLTFDDGSGASADSALLSLDDDGVTALALQLAKIGAEIDPNGAVTYDAPLLSLDGGDGKDLFVAKMGNFGPNSIDDGLLSNGLIRVSNFETYDVIFGDTDERVSFSGSGYKGNIDLGRGFDQLSAVNRTGFETYDGGEYFDTLMIDNSAQSTGVNSTLHATNTYDDYLYGTMGGYSGRLYNAGGAYTQFEDFEDVSYRMGRGNDSLRIEGEEGVTADHSFLSVDGGAGLDRLVAGLEYLGGTDVEVDDGRLTNEFLEARGFESYDLTLARGNDTVSFSGSGFRGNVALGDGDDVLSAVNRTGFETFDGGDGFDSLTIDNSMQAKGVISSLNLDWQVRDGLFYNSGGAYTRFEDFEVVNYFMGSGNDTMRFEEAVTAGVWATSEGENGADSLAARLARLSESLDVHGAGTADTALLSVDGGDGRDYFSAMLRKVTAQIEVHDGRLSGAGILVTGFETYKLTLGDYDDTVHFSGSGFKGDVDFGSGNDRVTAVNRTGYEHFDGGEDYGDYDADAITIDNSAQTKGVSSVVTLANQEYGQGFSGRFYNAGNAYTGFENFEVVTYLMGRGNDTLFIENEAAMTGDSSLLSIDGGDGADYIAATVNSLEMNWHVEGGEGRDTLALDLTGLPVELTVVAGLSGLVVGLASFTGFESYHIRTGDGQDYLSGSSGNDTLAGGSGDDTYVVQNTGDVVVEGAGGGSDLILSSVSYSLAGRQVEALTLTGFAAINATGNTGGNRLTGNSGNNVLDAGLGNDTMAGGLGDDTYYVQSAGDKVVEGVDEGIDTVISSVAWSLSGKQVEKLILTGAAAVYATGNSLGNTITGNAGANVVDGAAGHDRLDGGAGADSLIGGTGNDTFVVDNAGDLVNEAANAGIDLVEASVTWTLGAQVEHLTLIGSAAINGTGNGQNNVLTGNAGNNVLTGGLGNDTYYVQNSGDKVVELAGEGTDVIYSSVTYSLNGRYAEAIILTGVASISATGNSLANSLSGNGGRNVLNGKGGADVLTGGLSADVFLFDSGSGADIITDFSVGQGDTIDISAYTGGGTFGDLVTQSGLDVLINLGGGNMITVQNTVRADVLAQMVW